MAPMRLHCQHFLPHWGLVHDVNSGLIGVMPKNRDSHLQLFSGTPPIAINCLCPTFLPTLLTLAQDQTTRDSKVSRVAPVGKVPVDEFR